MDASWTGKIAFGLIIIPVALYSAVEADPISFNLLHKKCGNRVSSKKYCPVCNEELKQEDIIRGHNYINDKYVTLTDDEMKSVKAPRSKSIVLDRFVNPAETKPQYYNKPYLVVPTGGDKPFMVLMDALNREQKVGIAKTVINSVENLLTLQVVNGEMIASTLYYAEEIRKSLYTPKSGNITLAEVNMACEVIRSMTKEFKYEEYHDADHEHLRRIIQMKIEEVETQKSSSSEQNEDSFLDSLKKTVRIAKDQNMIDTEVSAPENGVQPKSRKTKGKQARQ